MAELTTKIGGYRNGRAAFLGGKFAIDVRVWPFVNGEMRSFFVVVIMGGVLVGGCRSTSKPQAVEAKSRQVTAEVVQPKPTVRPVDAVRGRVNSVRDDLRFVIVDFAGSKLPRLDQQLSVYRFDQKVAELKISGPYRGTTVAADITAGEPKPGDLVRDR